MAQDCKCIACPTRVSRWRSTCSPSSPGSSSWSTSSSSTSTSERPLNLQKRKTTDAFHRSYAETELRCSTELCSLHTVLYSTATWSSFPHFSNSNRANHRTAWRHPHDRSELGLRRRRREPSLGGVRKRHQLVGRARARAFQGRLCANGGTDSLSAFPPSAKEPSGLALTGASRPGSKSSAAPGGEEARPPFSPALVESWQWRSRRPRDQPQE